MRSHYLDIRGVLRPARRALIEAREQTALHALFFRQWYMRRWSNVHGLPGPLIVTLTSYPPRFRTLDLTLKCLLSQSVKPDRVVLWLAEKDRALLPKSVESLREYGLNICITEDFRSYKKLIPALLANPNAYLVTADDDVFYSREWLRVLVDKGISAPRTVFCHRGRVINYRNDGAVAPYVEWENAWEELGPSKRVVPTGVGGVLYPPGALSAESFFEFDALSLAPNQDDLWFYWIMRLRGFLAQKVGPWPEFKTWPGSQDVRLAPANTSGGGNDRAVENLLRTFGDVTQ